MTREEFNDIIRIMSESEETIATGLKQCRKAINRNYYDSVKKARNAISRVHEATTLLKYSESKVIVINLPKWYNISNICAMENSEYWRTGAIYTFFKFKNRVQEEFFRELIKNKVWCDVTIYGNIYIRKQCQLIYSPLHETYRFVIEK